MYAPLALQCSWWGCGSILTVLLIGGGGLLRCGLGVRGLLHRLCTHLNTVTKKCLKPTSLTAQHSTMLPIEAGICFVISLLKLWPQQSRLVPLLPPSLKGNWFRTPMTSFTTVYVCFSAFLWTVGGLQEQDANSLWGKIACKWAITTLRALTVRLQILKMKILKFLCKISTSIWAVMHNLNVKEKIKK